MTDVQEPKKAYRRSDQFEDEIELIDYLRILWKWKWLIIGGTLLCILVASVYAFTRPVVKMYKASVLIEIDPKAKLDPLDKIKSMIEYGIFNQQVLNDLSKLQGQGIPKPESLSFDVAIPKGLNLLDIAYKTPSPDLGRAVLNTLIRELKQEYKEMIDKAKYQLDEKIREISESIKDNQTDIKIININNNNNKIDALRSRIKDVQASIPLIKKRFENNISLKEEAIRKNRSNIESLRENIGTIRSTIEQIQKVFQAAQLSSEKLTAKREAIVLDSQNNKGQGDTFLHAAAIQRIINYPIELRNEINSLSFQEKQFFKEIFSENESIKDLEGQIQVLRMEKNLP